MDRGCGVGGDGKTGGGSLNRVAVQSVRVQVQSLVGELGSHRPHNVAKKKKDLDEIEDL